MTGVRKFGTFSGVFTPSILTILGVIMYLRLPSIVGQAGLAGVLGIIVIAHIISVTTGLSVASVATDRKVRGGGTYYMLSRSLGLPIGGTLGIALFVGLSFAVSLYIIGFAESFLGFWGIEPTINTIRIVGSIVLLAVTIVTLISTSLALRAQFFILTAIALSILSILLGAGRHDLAPGTGAAAALDALPNAAPFIVLFGIFFPAVTGFEAGVSMSGDLRDPKKSIPVGTIAAILVGLVVYIGLAAFLAYTVDAQALATNPNVLLEISVAAPLVLAGVWGATLSSALGSTLAAPRILQATSIDRITPTFFARGYGRENEPRHALLLTFAIALAGILIGELDVIARIVSMFFITAYGFLNLSCAIESWASPDFRPSFRVPRAIPVVGALACLVVMIQLDLVAMVGATIVLGGLYLFLTRRQLRLEAGDAWSGFWASVARAALHRLDRGAQHRRNWRPNVLAFATPEARRDRVFLMARELAGRRGMLTLVDVVSGGRDAGALVRGETPEDAASAYGVFTRAIESSDPYDCVAGIARYHGFAGIEPNALLLPWPDRPDDAFETLLERLAAIDQNLLLLAAAELPAGRQPSIDVWWWGEPERALLGLSMLRALTTNDTWRAARVRVLTAPDAGAGSGIGVERRMNALLDDMRIDAEVRVLHDAGPSGNLTDVVAAGSATADLVLLDATPFTRRPRVLDAARADDLRARLRSVLFLLPGSGFGAPARPALAAPRTAPVPARVEATPPRHRVPGLRLPDNADLARVVDDFHAPLGRIAEDSVEGPLLEAYARNRAMLEGVAALLDDSLVAAATAAGRGRARTERAVRKVYGDMLFRSRRLLESQRRDRLPDQAAALAAFADRVLHEFETLPDSLDDDVVIQVGRDAFGIRPDDGIRLRVFKLAKRAAAPRSPRLRLHVPLRELVRRHLLDAVPIVERAQRDFIMAASVATTDAQTLLADGRGRLERIRAAIEQDDDIAALAGQHREELRRQAAAVISRHDITMDKVREDSARAIRQIVHRFVRDAERVDVARRARIARRDRRDAAAAAARARDLPGSWESSQALLIEGVELEVTLLALRNRIATIVARARDRLRLHVQNGLIARMRDVRAAIEEHARTAEADPGAEFTRIFEHWPEFAAEPIIDELRAELREPAEELPERVETLSPAAAMRLSLGDIDDVEVVSIALRPLVDYHIDAEFLGPLQDRLLEVPATYARATDSAQDAVRLTAFRFRGPESDEEDGSSRVRLLNDALRRIDAGLSELDALVIELDGIMAARLEHTLAGLEPHRLLRETNRLPQYIRARRGREALTWFQERRRTVQRFAGEQAVRLLYQRSEAVRFARELETRDRTGSALLDLVATVSPDPRVLERLPYHYRQLFLGKPGFSRDF